jgi:hypothetical protein
MLFGGTSLVLCYIASDGSRMTYGGADRPAWYTYPAGRLRFLTELRACGVHAISTRINRADRRHRGGFQVEFELTVPKLEARSGAGPVPLHNSGRQRWPAQPPLSPAPQRAGRVVFGPSGQR